MYTIPLHPNVQCLKCFKYFTVKKRGKCTHIHNSMDTGQYVNLRWMKIDDSGFYCLFTCRFFFFYVGCCCELNSIRVTANHSGEKKNHPIVRSWMVVYWRYKRNEPCPMNGHNYSKFCFDNNITGRVSVFGVHFRDYIWQVVHLLFVRSVTTIECSRFFGFSSALQLWFIPVANQATNASVEIISILLSFKNTRSTRFRFQ